jgi:hypothetical protein
MACDKRLTDCFRDPLAALFATILCLGGSQDVSAQPLEVRRVVEMSYPVDGVTDLLVEWGAISGWQPRLAGDVDGDGFDDLLVVRFFTPDDLNRTYISLVYGQRLTGAVDIGELRETRFLDARADLDPLLFPGCPSPHGPAGDVDADGYDDFFLSACEHSRNGIERSGFVL